MRAVVVEVRPRFHDEHNEKIIRRFLKKVKNEKILETFKSNMYYEKPSVARRKKNARRKKVVEQLQAEVDKKNLQGR